MRPNFADQADSPAPARWRSSATTASSAASSADGHAAMQPAQQAAGQVRRAARVQGGDRVPGGGLVAQLPCGHDHADLVVEGHEPEAVSGLQAVDEAHERRLGGVEALAVHRPAAVEHDLHPRRGARLVGRRRRGDELEQHRHLVLPLDGDDVDVEVRVHLHVVLLGSACASSGSHAAAPA